MSYKLASNLIESADTCDVTLNINRERERERALKPLVWYDVKLALTKCLAKETAARGVSTSQ